MTGKLERGIHELYRSDPERADAVVFGRRTGISRRGFLGGAGLAAMGGVAGGEIVFGNAMPGGLIPAAFAQDAKKDAAAKGPQLLQFPGKDANLVLLGDKPLVAETPEHLLDDETTPTSKFYIRNNGQIPEATKEPDKWKLVVDGEVNKKLELTLGELKAKFKPVTQRMVLECGGNGRSFFTPQARGNQWTNGGAGCAEWTGVRVADILKAAGLKPSAVFSGHYGADPHLSGDPQKSALSRGVPIKADGRQQPHRLGNERQAAGAYSRVSRPPCRRRLARLALEQMAHAHLGARQGARRPGHGRHILPRRRQSDRARRQG